MKPGYKTTELWVSLVVVALLAFNAVPTPHTVRGWTIAAVAVGYAVSRGLSKVGTGQSALDDIPWEAQDDGPPRPSPSLLTRDDAPTPTPSPGPSGPVAKG